MKHTTEQIKEKAHQVMKDLDGKFYFETCIIDTHFSKDKAISLSKAKGKTISVWIVGVKAIFDNEDLLIISDETGEPLYYQNFNTFVFNIEKDDDGKYYKVES